MQWNVAEFQRTIFKQVGVTVPPRGSVLDLGCGNGVDAEWFAERARETIGVDILPDARWPGLERPGLSFKVGNAESLEFPDQRFDLVFLKDVLHHAEHPVRVLQEARRVAGPGGRIYVIEGNRFNPLFYVHMTLMLGHQHFRRPAFVALVRQVFPDAQFRHFEAHVYPFRAAAMVRSAHMVEELIGTLPLVRRLTSYNAAVAVR